MVKPAEKIANIPTNMAVVITTFLFPAEIPSSIILLKSKGWATTKNASITTTTINKVISTFSGAA